MAEKDNKNLLLLAAAGVGLYLLSKNQAHAAVASGQNPNLPPPSVPPAGETNAQLLAAWSTWIHNLLKQFGYTTQPSYQSQTSATEEIIDATGAGRNLVSRNQGATDNFHQFMWDVNGALVFHTWNPDADPTHWAGVKAEYLRLQQDFTPAFLT